MADIIVLDFETYYDRAFSLSKMTTEEYIRDPLFEPVGVSVKVNDTPAEWMSGTKAQMKKWLDRFDWGNSVGVAHNAMFDMAILNWHFDIRPKRIVDTLSMLRAIDGPDAGNSLAKAAERYGLGAKGDEVINALGKRRLDFSPEEMARYAQYCINDVELTYKLFAAMAPLLPPVEMRLIDLTIRMFSEPVLELDTDVLTKHLTTVKEKKAKLLEEVEADKSVLMSNPQLADLLTGLGVTPPRKISPTTGKETWAFGKTDEAFKALLDHEDPRVQAIVAARMGVKSTLEETRTERFIKIAERGTLPVPLRYYAAHTGRFGGSESVNMQNLPRGSILKKAILAPEGYVIIDCDSSQIEARTLAWLAGQDDLVEAFDRGEDVYKIMASAIYAKAVEDINKGERQVGKVTVLGAGYGLGWRKFVAYAKQQNIVVTDNEAERIITTYRETYRMIPRLWKQGDDVVKAIANRATTTFGRDGVVTVNLMGVRLPNGLYLKYPNMRLWEDPDTGRRGYIYDQKKGRATLKKSLWGGGVVENVCQALARIIIGEQMLAISKRYKVAMTVHDSVVALVPEAEADEARKFVEECMRTRPKWAPDLPLNCESKMGASYGG